MITWGEFAKAEPDLSAFGAGRLGVPPAYLATVRQSGAPRVHPVTPIITAEGLFLFMEPTSPKGRDLRERGWYALHNGVPEHPWLGWRVLRQRQGVRRGGCCGSGDGRAGGQL